MTILYRPKDRQTSSAVRKEIDAFWLTLKRDPGCRKEVLEAGIDPAAAEAVGPGGITLEIKGSSMEPTSMGILLAFSSTVLHDLWKQVLLPRLKQKLGESILIPVTPDRKPRKKAARKSRTSSRSERRRG